MTIDEIHKFINFLSNQYQNRYFEPEEIDRVINESQKDKFNQEIKLFQKNNTISDSLAEFIKDDNVSLTAGSGSLPSDFEYRIRVSETDESPVEIVEESEWNKRLASDIEAPSADYPACLIRNNILVRPTSISSINLTYFKTPNEVEWAYTVSGSDLIYDAGNSTQLEWSDSSHVDIVRRSCVYLGIPLNDQGLTSLKSYKSQTENV